MMPKAPQATAFASSALSDGIGRRVSQAFRGNINSETSSKGLINLFTTNPSQFGLLQFTPNLKLLGLIQLPQRVVEELDKAQN